MSIGKEKGVREMSIKDKLLAHYKIEEKQKNVFLLKVDWILENAVYPVENGYSDNIIDLWDIYMPSYEMDSTVLEYSKFYYPVLRYLHEGRIGEFNNIKYIMDIAIKNYIKFSISQGQTSRISLVSECIALFKNFSDAARLYSDINQAIDFYFENGEIDQECLTFLRRFQDYDQQPYIELVVRVMEIDERRRQIIEARSNLLTKLGVDKNQWERLYTLINIVLCKLALTYSEEKFSEVLAKIWSSVIPDVPYEDAIYLFVEKNEKEYMNACFYNIESIADKRVIMSLYKDAVILRAALDNLDKDEEFGIHEVVEFWKNDGMHFADRRRKYSFDRELARMKNGFNKEIISTYSQEIKEFHEAVLKKVTEIKENGGLLISSAGGSDKNSSEKESDGKQQKSAKRERDKEKDQNRLADAENEMKEAEMNQQNRKLDALAYRIAELEEMLDNSDNLVFTKFIALLDDKKYDHVLGKLYRAAYFEDELKGDEIKSVLKNMFEIMNINGVDVYGEIGSKVSYQDIKLGKYRVDKKIEKDGIVKYPGYRIGDSVILHPLAEEE